MSRQSNVGKEEIERAKQMRDQSMSINQYRKALSVILAHLYHFADTEQDKWLKVL